jgi:pimeloyl-ACP methyl ester carboxylesterase
VSNTAARIMRWIGKALLWAFVALLALTFVGAIYQTVAMEVDRRTYPAPGQLVEVGGHHLHIRCVGQGTPTVILEAANGGMSAHWARVQQEVAKATRTCAYDRAGLGWSESGPRPRDARQISSELHTLLGDNDANIEGPYVLVGHSYGGLYARMYTTRYSEEVAGVVLVDSSHPEQFTRSPQGREMYERARRLTAVAALSSRLGLIRLFDVFPAPSGLPAQQRAQVEASLSSTRHLVATAEEFSATPQTSAQVRTTQGLGDKPLAVVSAGEQPPGWLELQEELVALSSNSSLRIVEGATHESLLSEKRDARVTSAAILEVVEAVHNDEPHTPKHP